MAASNHFPGYQASFPRRTGIRLIPFSRSHDWPWPAQPNVGAAKLHPIWRYRALIPPTPARTPPARLAHLRIPPSSTTGVGILGLAGSGASGHGGLARRCRWSWPCGVGWEVGRGAACPAGGAWTRRGQGGLRWDFLGVLWDISMGWRAGPLRSGLCGGPSTARSLPRRSLVRPSTDGPATASLGSLMGSYGRLDGYPSWGGGRCHGELRPARSMGSAPGFDVLGPER